MVGLVGVFLLYPAADTVWTSLTDSTGIGKAHFIGIDNYTALVHDPAFKTSFVNTLYWVAGVLVLQVGLGLALALVLSSTAMAKVLKGVFYLPAAISAAATGVIWYFVFNPDQGLLNSSLRLFGLDGLAQSWLVNPPTNTFAMIVGVHVAGAWADDVALSYRPPELSPRADRGRARRRRRPFASLLARDAAAAAADDRGRRRHLADQQLQGLRPDLGYDPGWSVPLFRDACRDYVPRELRQLPRGLRRGRRCRADRDRLGRGRLLPARDVRSRRGELMATADFPLEVPAGRRLVEFARPASKAWLLVLGMVWLLPLWLLVITPMKSTPEYTDGSQWALPTHPLRLFSNLRTAWDSAGLGPGFVASLTYGLTGASLAILFGSLGAYAITRLGVRLGFFWFILVFSGTIFPFQMYLIPLFNLYLRTGLYDTWLGMALFYTSIAIPFCLFVMHGFFSTIPHEVQDAARLDGASDFRIYWRIFMPLAWGPIAVLLLFQFTWIWNDLLFGLVLSTSDGVRPITPAWSDSRACTRTAGRRSCWPVRCSGRYRQSSCSSSSAATCCAGSCSRRDADDGHAAGDARSGRRPARRARRASRA